MMFVTKTTALFILYLGLFSCTSVSKSDSVIGKYVLKQTGKILFEVKMDTAGYYTILANNGRKSSRDSFRLKEFKSIESEWSGFCGKSYDLWMSKHIIGGDDWKPNFKIGLYNDYNKFYFLSLEKGYASKEHNFSSGFCVITGSECFVSNIFRLNIDKVE